MTRPMFRPMTQAARHAPDSGLAITGDAYDVRESAVGQAGQRLTLLDRPGEGRPDLSRRCAAGPPPAWLTLTGWGSGTCSSSLSALART